MTKPTSTNKPFDKIKIGPITAAIWKTDTANGPLFNVTFDRAYRNSDGVFGNTGSFRPNDLLVLAKLADRTHTVITDGLAAGSSDETDG